VRAPGLAPKSVEDLVETVDLMPTILELLGITAPQQVQRRSLLPAIAGHRGTETQRSSVRLADWFVQTEDRLLAPLKAEQR
jgi:arylsulfatase